MKTVLEAIQAEAVKLIVRHERYAYGLADEYRRRSERTARQLPARVVLRPAYWTTDQGFDPYHVRRNAGVIAHAVRAALRGGSYYPRPALLTSVPKGDSERVVSVFQVADAAVSTLFYKRLLHKNASRLSPHAYAYRTDITLHDAISRIAYDIRGKARVYVAEFDFRRYFDSIGHEYIRRILLDEYFHVTRQERHVLEAFMTAPAVPGPQYASVAAVSKKDRGIHLGTSVSLFLANIAGFPLDRALEKIGVGFVRYADDIVIWSEDYALVARAVDAVLSVAHEMNVDINFEKSPGISILAPPPGKTEFATIRSVELLGYQVTSQAVGIRSSSVAAIKQRLARIVYTNLLAEPKLGQAITRSRLQNVDRDYMVMLLQLRRYLYGDLTEAQLRRYLARDLPRIRFRGLMSFYPLLTDERQLKELDGWLLHLVFTTLRRRRALLTVQNGLRPTTQPFGFGKRNLLSFRSANSLGVNVDLRLPSFLRMAKLIRRASAAYGANVVANQRAAQYYSVT